MTQTTQIRNKSRLKQVDWYACLPFLFFGWCGSLLIYRANLDESELMRIEGVLDKVERSDGYGNYGSNYAILICVQGESQVYGVSAGTETQSQALFDKINIQPGMKYSYYLDPTVGMTINGKLLGITIIKNKNEVIFQRGKKAEMVGGIIFIVRGVIATGVLYFTGKKKFK